MSKLFKIKLKIDRIIRHLSQSTKADFKLTPIDDTYMVIVDDLKELPIFLIVEKSQVLVVCNLCLLTEINSEKKEEFLENINILNFYMNLSSFSQNSTHYIIFGSLSVKSKLNVIEEEILTLANNTKEALLHFEDFLQ